MELLWAEQDYETIAFFWRLNEWVSKFESENKRGTCQISLSLLKRKLGWNRSRSLRVLGKINSSFQMKTELQSDNETVLVFTPNWLELQENRGGKNRAKTKQKRHRGKKREERGEKENSEDLQNPPSSEPKNDGSALLEVWNKHRGPLPEAVALTGKRKSHAIQRLEEIPDLNYWADVVARMAGSEFCNGANDRGWTANFDFLLRPDTHVKVIEGSYQNKRKRSNTTGVNLDL